MTDPKDVAAFFDAAAKAPGDRPGLNEVVAALRPVFGGEMLLIRKIRGVRLRDGREMLESDRADYFLYDVGVQEERDSSATLWGWDEIREVLV